MQQVLVLIPIKPTLNPILGDKAALLARRMIPACPDLELTICFDARRVDKEEGDHTPWSRVTRARNRLLDIFRMEDFPYDWIMWIDADVVEYPSNLAQWLVHGAMNYADNGVCAPTVLIEGTDTFYDTSAFIYKDYGHVRPETREYIPGRNVDAAPPYYWCRSRGETDTMPKPDKMPPFVEMDCVGTCYAVHRDVYLAGARHTDHPSFTDHFSICQKALEMGRKVVALPNVTAWHANLPLYAGEAWH